MTAPCWFAVHTHAHREEIAAAHLERQGYRVFLPRYGKLWRHARRTQHVTRPLFPRYLFVALDRAVDGWRAIRSTVGVADIVRHGNHPSPVPAGVVEDLIRRRDENGLISLPKLPPMRPGAPVRLLDGAFASLTGLYDGMADSDRVVVLLELLGRKVRVMLPAEGVAPA